MTRQTANLTAKSSLSAVEAALAARRDLHIRAARESLRLAMSHATTVVHEQPETAPTPNYDWRVQ